MSTVGKVKDGVKKVKKEVDSWKDKLSGAFNEEELFISLFMIGFFYVGYTAGDAFIDKDSVTNEDSFTRQNCECDYSVFYRLWFSCCCLIWLALFSYMFLSQFCVKRCPKLAVILKALVTIFHSAFLRCCCYCCCHGDKKAIEASDSTDSHNYHSSAVNETVVKQNLTVLWFQYYKLHVVGYTKHGENVKPIATNATNTNNTAAAAAADIETDTPDSARKLHTVEIDELVHNCFCCECKKSYQDDLTDCICCGTQCIVQPMDTLCRSAVFGALSLKGIVRIILLFAKFVAQASTVPLIFLQMFDTYSLLCFSPTPYCSGSSEYRIHLAQAAITMSFLCCLALAQLTSALLKWEPWPKKTADD